MARQICHVIASDQAGQRLDSVLAQAGLYPSRSAAVKAIESGFVLVNGVPASKKHSVSTGDAVVCAFEDDGPYQALQGEPIDLDVRFEDNDVIVLSKPAGMLTHPSADQRTATLVNALLYRYGKEGLCNVQGEDDRPGIVHRLDGDTSGLMLAAKTDAAGKALMDAIRLREVDRRYICLVHGIIAPDTAMIDAPIARDTADRKRMRVADSASSRDAITTFNVLARFSGTERDAGYTLVECKLYTGRTHQIRVHMQYVKHPVVGDATYTKGAPKDKRASFGLTRQFLHSYKIGFAHPESGEHLEFSDRLPQDLAEVLETLSERCIETTEYGKNVLNRAEGRRLGADVGEIGG